jgi:uncharacterized membrane protein YebE (DUF533 family)
MKSEFTRRVVIALITASAVADGHILLKEGFEDPDVTVVATSS